MVCGLAVNALMPWLVYFSLPVSKSNCVMTLSPCRLPITASCISICLYWFHFLLSWSIHKMSQSLEGPRQHRPPSLRKPWCEPSCFFVLFCFAFLHLLEHKPLLQFSVLSVTVRPVIKHKIGFSVLAFVSFWYNCRWQFCKDKLMKKLQNVKLHDVSHLFSIWVFLCLLDFFFLCLDFESCCPEVLNVQFSTNYLKS